MIACGIAQRWKTPVIRAFLVLLLLLPFAPQSSEAFVFRKIVYCSPIVGEIHWAGRPIPEISVIRELRSGGFEGGKYVDSTKTNAQGQFKFDAVEERRLFRPDLISANPNITQLMWLTHDGERYAFWSYTKDEFHKNSESKEGIIKIECDLSGFEQYDHGRIVRCKHNGNQIYQ